MKQTIRLRTFETNSSSYHSLSIRRTMDMPKPAEIEKGKDVEIDSKVDIHYIGSTSSYMHISKGSYAKAQSVLRFMGYEVENQLDELIQDHEWKTETYPGSGYFNYNWDIKRELYKKKLYDIPLIKAFVKAIKRYIGEEYNVTIKCRDRGDVVDTVGDYDKSTAEVFGLANLTDIDAMADCFYNIIFTEDIEMIEECESNE